MSQYLKPDSELGYIEDQAEIENLKVNNVRHTILGCMLGDFDETGAYVVAPEIVKELIEMPKYIVESLDNIEVCKSILKLDKQITFMVTFEGNKATLTLVEKLSFEANFAINSGTYSNINEYILDSVETSGEVNRNAIYQRWNIGNNEGSVVDVFNCDPAILEKYFGIVNRFKYLLQANKIFLEKEEEIEEIESEYANEIFDILKRYPKLQEVVVKQIQTTLNEKKDAISVDKPNFAKTFNELLENTIYTNISVLDEKQKEEFYAERRNAIVNMNLKRSEKIETEIVDVDNVANADLSPKSIVIKTETTLSKSVNDLGVEYSAIYKKAMSRDCVNGKQKLKLLDSLAGFGLAKAIGYIQEKTETTVGTLVAGAVEKIQAKQETKTVKKAAAQTTKKPVVKSSATRTSTTKKTPAKKVGVKKNTKAKTKEDEKNSNTNQRVSLVTRRTGRKKSKFVGPTTTIQEYESSKNPANANRQVRPDHQVRVGGVKPAQVAPETNASIAQGRARGVGVGQANVLKTGRQVQANNHDIDLI